MECYFSRICAQYDFSFLEVSTFVRKIAEDDWRIIFEVVGDDHFGESNFVAEINALDYLLKNGMLDRCSVTAP